MVTAPSKHATVVATTLLLCAIFIAPVISFNPGTSSTSVVNFNRCTRSASAADEKKAATTVPVASCGKKEVTRRTLVGQIFTSALASNVILGNSNPASAKVVATPLTSASSDASTSQERNALLQAIARKSSDDVIEQAIQNLFPLNPLKSSSPSEYSSALDGEWKLLWYNKSDFSPLLKLPSPLRPDSYQYFGKIAEQEVGEGRVAQGLVGGVVSLSGGPKKELWLSSGAVPSKGDPSILEIYPPFRFQLGETPGSSSPKSTIVESESDADFRAANARTVEAQQAPKNEYEQVYLENGGSGSLRISVITKGDPVIVGDMFVHQKV